MSYDPYLTKQDAVNPVYSQVQLSSQPGTVAQPPPGHVVMPAAQSHSPGYHPEISQPHGPPVQSYTPRPPPGRWRDGICDWPNNLYPSCYCACCCFYGMWLVGQMNQKTRYMKLSSTVGFTAVVWIVAAILTLATGAGVFVLVIPMLYSFGMAIFLRMHIIKTEGITESGPFGEFCTGFWCWYCSVAQMARHLYGYRQVLDGDGDPDRPDNYQPVVENQV